MYIAATQYILGIKPTWNGLSIKPCLPPEWKNIKVKRGFRGKTYNIDYPSIAHNTSIMEEGEKVK